MQIERDVSHPHATRRVRQLLRAVASPRAFPPAPPPHPLQKQKEAAAAALARAAEEKAAKQATADAAFQRWVVDKSVHDEALELLPKLVAHGRNEDTWRAVGLAYAYCHVYLDEKHRQFAVDVSENPKRSFEATFSAWTRKSHGFDEVRRFRCTCVTRRSGAAQNVDK